MNKQSKPVTAREFLLALGLVGFIFGTPILVLLKSPDSLGTSSAAKTTSEINAITAKLAPVYCANHTTLKLHLSDDLEAKGLPSFEGVKSLDYSQCKQIIENLCSLDQNVNFLESVATAKIAIGMRYEFALYAWGIPTAINSTNTSAGTHQQWIYTETGKYVYIDSARVSAVQY